MKRGPTLTKQQRVQLCAAVTKQEIYDGLKSIGNDKAPGIDGYNAFFFKHTWQIIKRDIIEAVQCFFTTGKLYKAFNCTLVSLIPKVQNPKTAGFIPGRKISDNIVLAHELVEAYTRKHIYPRCMLKIDLQKSYDSVEWGFLEQVVLSKN
ncbi:uncharacterized protein [Solanum lycopersicum]|uniref:uncharacterized protein n=1 Tax=Solanum lycopersicum TaxID=4081 RepID=UPI0002BC9C57